MEEYQPRRTPLTQVLHNSAMDLLFGLPLTDRMMVAISPDAFGTAGHCCALP
jgi:hypothetical protein